MSQCFVFMGQKGHLLLSLLQVSARKACLSLRFPHAYSASVTDSTGCFTTVKL